VTPARRPGHRGRLVSARATTGAGC
jgi:hypothetical protein